MKMVYVMGPRARGPAVPPGVAAPGGLSRGVRRAPAAVPAVPLPEPSAAPDPGAGHADAPETAAPAAAAAESAAPDTAAPVTVAAESAAPAAAEPDAPPPVVTYLTPAPPVVPAGPPTAALPADPAVAVAQAAADAFRPVMEQQAAWAGRRSELEQTYRRLQRQVQAQLSGLRVQLATRLRSRP